MTLDDAFLPKRIDKGISEKATKQLPDCPVCGAKAFIQCDTVKGFWFGWAVGCPRYCLNDGIHGHDGNTPREDRFVGIGFDTKEQAAAWWQRRVNRELNKENRNIPCEHLGGVSPQMTNGGNNDTK